MHMIQRHCCLLWAKARLKWTEAKGETDLRADESKFEILFGKLGRQVLWTKEERNHPALNSKASDGTGGKTVPNFFGLFCNSCHIFF